MSDYDDFYGVELPCIMLLTLVTLPIWLPVWTVWYVFVGYKENKNLPSVSAEYSQPIPRPVQPPKKPKFYNNQAEWKKYNP